MKKTKVEMVEEEEESDYGAWPDEEESDSERDDSTSDGNDSGEIRDQPSTGKAKDSKKFSKS